MKQIKIADDLYDRIKRDADSNFRTIGGQIEYMEANQRHHMIPVKDILNNDLEERQLELEGVLENPEPSKPAEPLERSKQIIVEINAISSNADQSNQDPDYWDELNAKKQALWDEWHQVTGR